MPIWAPSVTLMGLLREPRTFGRYRPSKQSNRFNLSDGMILMALISIATSLGTLGSADGFGENWILLASLNLLVVALWCQCIKFMQTNGISDNTLRIAMQVLIYPSATFSLAFVVCCSILMVVGLTSFFQGDDERTVGQLLTILVLLLLSCGWMYLTRLSFIAVLKRSQTENTE